MPPNRTIRGFDRLCSTGSNTRAAASSNGVSISEHVVIVGPSESGSGGLAHEMSLVGKRAYQEYEENGSLKHLEISIHSRRLAIEMTEEGSPENTEAIANLALSLDAQFKHVGELGSLEEAITLWHFAVALTPDDSPDKPERLGHLATSLKLRFEREGRSEDLQEAIDVQTQSIELVPDDHARKPTLLNDLVASLLQRLDHSEQPNDMENALSLQTRAVDLMPAGNPEKPSALSNLGLLYMRQFGRLGKLEDISRAITLHGQSVVLAPDDHPRKPAYLSNAGSSLLVRFQHLGDPEDLSRAIQLKSRAVDSASDDNPEKIDWLIHLGGALYERYERTGDAEDLGRAIAYQTSGVELTPDNHPDKPSRLSTLGDQLLGRFEEAGILEDLDTAITRHSDAVKLAPDGSPDKQSLLHSLCKSLQHRFEQGDGVADLEAAIRYGAYAVQLVPMESPQRAEILRTFGAAFLTRLRSPHSQASDATRGTEVFLQSMHQLNSPPLERLKAATQYMELLAEFSHLLDSPPPLSMLQAHQHALNLVSHCIWLGNGGSDCYTSKNSQIVGTLCDNAATAAIKAGEFGLALEWLEIGRTISWSKMFQSCTPVDTLRRVHPQLADELCLSTQTLQGGPSNIARLTLTGAQSTKPFFNALEYEELLMRIRKLDGFENFLRPKTFAQLAGACSAGPVVVTHIHQSRCDALILYHPDKVKHVPLPMFSEDCAEKLHKDLWSVLDTRRLRGCFRDGPYGDHDNRGANKYGRGGKDDPMRTILRKLWDRVVKPILDVIYALPPTNTRARSLPHITWCTNGPLAFLPLHAAGIYDMNGAVNTIMDHAVSSYAPTLEALLKPRMQVYHAGKNPLVLVVSQPTTPGCNSIPATMEETATVTSLFDTKSGMTALEGEDGTVNAVLSAMERHRWVHLACHGTQDHKDPANSAFLLHDGKFTLTELMSRSIPNADLAVLSACQTTTGDEKSIEEAMCLTTGMLNVGYKSVVGTMWSISDSSAPVFMQRFYEVMAEQVRVGGELQPAYALHEATKTLRAKYGATEFMRWIPFVHFGL